MINQRTRHIFLMRFMLCKIHCPPFICFCKPTPPIYTHGPLKLENNPIPIPIPKVASLKPDTSDPIEIKEETSLRSNLRKSSSLDPATPKDEMKKRVQWMDSVGKQLVDIREFECSELDDTDNDDDNSRSCICVIL